MQTTPLSRSVRPSHVRGTVRLVGAVTAAVVLGWLAVPARCQAGFGLTDVTEMAKQLAAQPYQPPTGQVPDWLLNINYDQWRDIRFRPERSLWRDARLPFEVQFFHPGLYFDRTVAVNVIDAKGVHPVPFSTDTFNYGKNDFVSRIPANLGFAGFRVHAPINTRKYFDEVIVFLGASYFRAVAKNLHYGLSARGVAVDTVEPRGEEFPSFTQWWLVRPRSGAKELMLYALLDGRSVTGAYQFVVRPGTQTLVRIDARLFIRDRDRKIGLAPLTSMFFFGENTVRHFDKFQPEIHDSDGLLMHAETGEWLWRPLDNPATLQVNSFQMPNPMGFGLLQRDRNYDHYQDLETRQEERPSAWVETRSKWGPGQVQLVQLPTDTDIHDNIVAYWVPAELPPSGQPLSFAYDLFWFSADAQRPPGGRAIDTRREPGKMEGAQRIIVDFDGPRLRALPAGAPVDATVTVVGGDTAGQIVDQHVIKNSVTGGWRLSFQVKPFHPTATELRAFLHQGGNALTETWTYTLAP